MSDYEIATEMAIQMLHGEAVMQRAASEQAIFLLVEGNSEEVALPLLFTDLIDLNTLGVKLANYNGRGNLPAALRLLKLTLSHDRPIIVTYDNDPGSVACLRKCQREDLLGESIYTFPIPTDPVVTYSNGHRGGSFEESFPVETFLNVAFSDRILPPKVATERHSFESHFDPQKPWLTQLRKFSEHFGFRKWREQKPVLAEALAFESDELPPTFSRLVTLIRKVREKHPVVHPDEVELPKVLGLTYFPENEEADKYNEDQ